MKMQAKTKKIINIVLDVLVAGILIMALVLVINRLVQHNKGYVEFFGKAKLAVLTDSMDGKKPNSFKKGDMLTIEILKSDEAKSSLEIGDIVTFRRDLDGNGTLDMNTHRIVDKIKDTNGRVIYATRGDKPGAPDDGDLLYADVIGKYLKHVPDGGKLTMWAQSSGGSFVCLILPSLIVVGYCIYLVIKAATEVKRKKASVDEKVRLREEIMRELGLEPKPELAAAVPDAALSVALDTLTGKLPTPENAPSEAATNPVPAPSAEAAAAVPKKPRKPRTKKTDSESIDN